MKTDQVERYLQKDFLYDELLCGFVSFRPDGKILSINKTMATWLETDLADLKERNFKTLMTKSSMLYYNMVVAQLLYVNQSVNEISLKFLAKDGFFDVLLNAQSYKNDQGDVFLINATIQKISERKRYENELLYEKRHAETERRKFEFLFNSAPNHIWTTDSEGKILMINQRVKDYFNLEQPTDFYGLAGIWPADRKKWLSRWKLCLSSGKVFERHIRLQGVSGFPEWFLIRAEPFYNEDGVIEIWFCSGTNINKQKLLELATQADLKSSLSSAYKTLDENAELFVSIAMNHSHMVRKPLANILGLVKLMEMENVNGDLKTLMELLLESTQELDSMIKKLNH